MVNNTSKIYRMGFISKTLQTSPKQLPLKPLHRNLMVKAIISMD
jgi:hypothetical protein